jgi:hypothetical protein
MKTPNHPIIKGLIDFVDNPARDLSYMDERRRKQNARGWLRAAGCSCWRLAGWR